MRQIVLDTETTGLEVAEGNRILEIGCVELFNRQLTGKHLHLYINPERDSEEGALKVHGLSSDFLRDKPRFAEVADTLLTFVQGAEIIIHNAPFDVKFLDHELQLCGQKAFSSHVSNIVDSLALAKEQYPGKRNSLDALCDRLEVNNAHRTLHGALLDAELLAEVYIRLTRGQESLMIESSHHASDATAHLPQADYSQMALALVQTTEHERTAHAAMLAAIDKASGGKTVWKKWLNPENAP